MTVPASVELPAPEAPAVASAVFVARVEDSEGATDSVPAVSAVLAPQAEVRKITPTKAAVSAAFLTDAVLAFTRGTIASLERFNGHLFHFKSPLGRASINHRYCRAWANRVLSGEGLAPPA